MASIGFHDYGVFVRRYLVEFEVIWCFLLHSRVRFIGLSPSVVIRVDQERFVKRVTTSSHRALLMQSRAMKLKAATVPGKPASIEFKRISLTDFTAPLAVLITGASQSRQHGKSESDSHYLSD
ncbi:hypothetical protein Tco_0034480 [Tanacetum coccineum]